MLKVEEALASAALVRKGLAKFVETERGLSVSVHPRLKDYCEKHRINSAVELLEQVTRLEKRKEI